MNNSILKTLTSIILCFNQIYFLYSFSSSKILNAKENEINLIEYTEDIPENSFYIIGPGDTLKVRVNEQAKDLDSIVNINGEGIGYFKRLSNLYVEGLSIKELSNVLNEKYSTYVKYPDVVIEIEKYRPIEIYIDGEIEKPGVYKLYNNVIENSNNGLENNDFINNLSNSEEEKFQSPNYQIKSNQSFAYSYPKLIDALKKAGGITYYANLENIEVTRINPISKGGGRIKTNLNILGALNLGDNSQNIRIYDRDTIYIKKSQNPVFSQISKAIKSNINPDFINVSVTGRVQKPGNLKVSKNYSLNEALLLAGGTKVLKGKISFLRYENDGMVDFRKIPYRKNSKRGSKNNPYLKNGDLIYVGDSFLTRSNQVVGEITSPFKDLLSTYFFFKLLEF